MRITRTHHLPTILENLHVANPWNSSERGVLLDPGIHDSAQFREAHSWNGKIMPRRKTQHAADSPLRLSLQQAAQIKLQGRDFRQHRGVIIAKNVGFRIPRSLGAARALVARTQIAVGIESERGRLMNLFHSSEPWTLGRM